MFEFIIVKKILYHFIIKNEKGGILAIFKMYKILIIFQLGRKK